MKKHLLPFLLVFATAFGVAACGNPFEDAINDLEEIGDVVDNSDGTYTEEDKKATVSISFADESTMPTEPSVGQGLSASQGEYAIVAGLGMSFNIPGSDTHPQLSGTLFPGEGEYIASGMKWNIIEDAKNQDDGDKAAMLFFEIDEETSWMSIAGEIEVVSLRPLKLKFTGVKMGPLLNSGGFFTVEGTANWNK